ncbi:MAG: lipid II:glycine glycyltransferase FemX [Candidatus Dormibacteria bacterium]
MSVLRTATSAEVRGWDELVLANPDGGHILQSRAWGEFKRDSGWEPRFMVAELARPVAVLFLVRRIAGLGTLWYTPKGPGIAEADMLPTLARAWCDMSQGFLLKCEPELEVSVDTSAWPDAGLRKARLDVQGNAATIFVDLARKEDDILASFKSKTRYNIRLAARKGVTVRRVPVDERSADAMYRLMRATSQRGEFILRPRSYFETYWRMQEANDQGALFFAFLADEVLAGVFVTHFGARGWYKDGGSSRRHHELMAPYLLQWEVMRWLRSRGVRSYDLVAVPRRAELHEGHRFWGLYRFKSGFHDDITEFVGTWDVPRSERRYRLWDPYGEKLARQWVYRVNHDIFY